MALMSLFSTNALAQENSDAPQGKVPANVYFKDTPGYSYARKTDGAEPWESCAAPTKGVSNSASTSISRLSTKVVVNGVAYNLQGQRVSPDYRGIIIVNGKKILKK